MDVTKQRRSARWCRPLVGLAVFATAAASLVGALSATTTASADGLPSSNASDGNRNVTAVMFQWPWTSIGRECKSTLGPAGYGYVLTSPPQETARIGDQWWTSYQPVSYKIDGKEGTRAEFAQMVKDCNSAGVKVMIDAVINHMSGPPEDSTGLAGSSFSYYDYPGIYSDSDFHDCRRDIDWSKNSPDEDRTCQLVGLSDLKTETDAVRTKIADYMNDLISLGVSGFRIDAAKHVWPADLAAIKAKLTDPDVYFAQEVINGEGITESQYWGTGQTYGFDYAKKLKNVFGGSSLNNAQSIANGLTASADAAVFVDNHDTERGSDDLTYKDGASYQLANVFMLAYPYGSPNIQSGFAFSDTDAGAPVDDTGHVKDATCGTGVWVCEHAEQPIVGMVGFHNAVGDAAVNNWWTNGSDQIAFGRGDKGYVVINKGGALTRTFQTSLAAGTYCDVVASDATSTTCDAGHTVTVDGSGTFTATVPANGALAIDVAKKADGTDPTSTPTPTPTASTTPTPTVDTTVYYSTDKDWSSYYIHYQVGDGAWTTAPGEQMEAACTGWVKKEIDTTGASALTVTFNNGSGTWDNNGSQNYALATGVSAVKDGSVSTTSPCATDGGSTSGSDDDTAHVYYSTDKGWSAYNIHYQVGDGAWTTVPGVAMAAACDGWVEKDIELGDATTLAVTFTDGSGTWDNNGSKNYALSGGVSAVKDGAVSTTNPCPAAADTTAPTAPTDVTATAGASAITVSWTASSDDTGVTGYIVSRTGGGAPATFTATGTSYADSSAAAGVTYAYTVQAKDAAGNVSAASDAARATIAAAGDDTEAPTAPGDLDATSSDASVTLTWTASDDDVAVDAYVIVRTGAGGTTTTTTAAVSYTDTDVTTGAVYHYSVAAVDAAGNLSAAAGPVTVTASDAASTGGDDDGSGSGSDDGSGSGSGDGSGDTGGTGSGTEGTFSDVISYGHYATNPDGGVGQAASITVDGDASDWNASELIAQGVANDDPRAFRGIHEGPVYDPYALYASWDDEDLYLMWQFTNVTDVVDPAQGYPISDNGKPYNGDIPISLAFDTTPGVGGDGLIDGTTQGVWGIGDTFTSKETDHMLMFSVKPGVGQPAVFSLNADGAFDYATADVTGFDDAGIEYAYGDGFVGSHLYGVDAEGASGYTPADLKDSAKYVDFLTKGHDTAQDTVYEMKIPFPALGITKDQLTSQGIGVMLISTFGASGIGSLPQDETTLDNALEPYSADESTSAEKEDTDAFSVPFARIGHQL